jgi:hypothetical protein
MISCLFVGKRPEEHVFEPITMTGDRLFKKPRGGLWTCQDDPRGRSHWREWNRSEGCSFTRGMPTWRLTVPEARVYTIDTYVDLCTALRRWPHHRYADSRFHSLREEVEINFEAMAAEYDAVELTEEGQWRTRLSHPHNLYGWDVPTILWFRWMFEGVERVRAGRITGVPA